MKKIGLFIVTALLSCVSVLGQSSNPTFDKEQYQKALWMTTRFYGAQRSGVGPNWLLAEHEPTGLPSALSSNISKFKKGQSFVKDADGSYDLSGGWFDCGDHVKFGQTEFYSAYMLLLGYSEFPTGYDDHYSFDYSGYIGASDYSWEGKKGKPNGIPDVLDEVKYATDYLMKCVRDKSTFYYQVGDGDLDHKHWVTASVMATLPNTEGGEASGSRSVSKASGNVTSMAALCGSALAAMARLYKPFDPAYADQCLQKALVAYDFVNGTAKGNSAAGGFYGSKPKYVPDLVIFSAELYRTTGDKKYLSDAEKNCSWMDAEKDYNYNYSLCYNNTEDLAVYLMATFKESSYQKKAMNVMDFYVNTMYKPKSGYILNVQKGGWGVLRFPCNQAFVYGLYAKLNDKLTAVDPYSLATIEYVMGQNSNNCSFITGFDIPSKNIKTVSYVHHRNYYGLDSDSENSVKVQEKFKQFGYLIGGTLSGSYSDTPANVSAYQNSEGGIDYNAGLVGALGYLNSIISPVNTNKFGHPTPDLGPTQSICGSSSILLDSQLQPAGQRKFTWLKDGKQVESSNTANTLTISEAGEYTCRVDSAGEWSTEASVTITATLPSPEEWPTALTLCDPASETVDATVNANVTYQWSKDKKEIEGATTATYEVTRAGDYTCVVAATGCPSLTLSVKVDSKLPEVDDAVSNANGDVTLTVTSEGDYEWYDVPEGGKALHTGATYKTTITADKTFYVQDAGAMSLTVGPTTKTFTGTATNWGDIAATFKAEKPLMITGVTVYIESVYGTGSQTLTATLSHNGKKQTFTSDAQNVSGKGFKEFTFSNPIEIKEVGDYSLSCKPSNGAVGFYQSGPDYSTYASQGNPITFTGADNGTASSHPFPGIVDWKVTSGSGCARAIVKAIKSDGTGLSVDALADGLYSIYPNPFEDVIYVQMSGAETDRVKVEIISLVGKTEMAMELSVADLANGLSLATLKTGVYMLRLSNGESSVVERIVKR